MKDDYTSTGKVAPVLVGAIMLIAGLRPVSAQVDFRRHCDQDDDCDISVIIRDGERTVIVDGDTVDTGTVRFLEDSWGDFDPPRFVWNGRHGLLGDEFSRLGSDLEVLRDFSRPLMLSLDGELRQMERDARDLAHRARKAQGEARQQLEADLDGTLQRIFEYKNDKKRESIDSLEDRLGEMKRQQEKRESARDEIIEQRKKDLLGEKNYLEW